MEQNNKNQLRYHLIFWATYIVLWSARDLIYHPNFFGNVFLNSTFSLAVAPFIYINISLLLPRYLLKQKLALYALYFGATFVLMFLVRFFTYQFIFNDIIDATETAVRFASGDGLVILASENAILLMITMALYLIQQYYGKEKYAHELEQKNMETELHMLKAQLQPHFLFNNLNTIYFLMETDPALAKEVMIQFSDVLSHQLYKAKQDKVSLKEELQSLESFLKIQQVRHDDFLKLKYSFPSDTGDLQIAPMILLTFIENAFKHGQKEGGYYIDISVRIAGDDLYLKVVNSIGDLQPAVQGGVGQVNVQRRLSLIYPDKHKLQLDKTEEAYQVALTMTLENNGQA